MSPRTLASALLCFSMCACDPAPARSPEITTPSTSAATSTTSAAIAPPAPGCPAAAPAQGSVCAPGDLDRVCDYGARSSCHCATSSCLTPAGPIPGCTESLGWVCRDDGCPWKMTGACAKEGQRCMQDDGMCAYDYECKAGAWKQTGGPGCRP